MSKYWTSKTKLQTTVWKKVFYNNITSAITYGIINNIYNICNKSQASPNSINEYGRRTRFTFINSYFVTNSFMISLRKLNTRTDGYAASLIAKYVSPSEVMKLKRKNKFYSCLSIIMPTINLSWAHAPSLSADLCKVVYMMETLKEKISHYVIFIIQISSHVWGMKLCYGVKIMKVPTFLNCKMRSTELLVMSLIVYHVDKYLKIIIY
jgi:hypothetical protein